MPGNGSNGVYKWIATAVVTASITAASTAVIIFANIQSGGMSQAEVKAEMAQVKEMVISRAEISHMIIAQGEDEKHAEERNRRLEAVENALKRIEEKLGP